MTSDPRRNRRQQVRRYAPATRAAEAISRFNSAWLSVLSLLGIALTSLGFSVTLALNSMFGPDILEVLRGPLDYLAVSAFIIISVYNGLADRVTGPAGAVKFLDGGLAIALLVLVAGVLWAYVHHHRSKLARLASRASNAARSGGRWVKQRPHSWRVPAIMVSSAVSGMLTYFIGRAVLAMFTVALLPFVMGYWATQAHFYVTVIEPQTCAKAVSAKDRRAAWLRPASEQRVSEDGEPKSGRPYPAICVEVRSKDNGPHKGRRIIATDESIALFDPSTGAVNIVPRKDAVVAFIDKL
jgi:hypothetical protein